jgi:hypothetical protein
LVAGPGEGKEESMITVSEEAKVLLKNVEYPEGVPEDTVLRLDPVALRPENRESQIGMYFGSPGEMTR